MSSRLTATKSVSAVEEADRNFNGALDLLDEIDKFLEGYTSDGIEIIETNSNNNVQNTKNFQDGMPNESSDIHLVENESSTEINDIEFIGKHPAVFQLLEDFEHYGVYEHDPCMNNYNVFYKTLPPGEHKVKVEIKEEPCTENINDDNPTNVTVAKSALESFSFINSLSELEASFNSKPVVETSLSSKPELESFSFINSLSQLEASFNSKPELETSLSSKPVLESFSFINSLSELEASFNSKPELETSLSSKPELESYSFINSLSELEASFNSKPELETSFNSKPELETLSFNSKPQLEKFPFSFVNNSSQSSTNQNLTSNQQNENFTTCESNSKQLLANDHEQFKKNVNNISTTYFQRKPYNQFDHSNPGNLQAPCRPKNYKTNFRKQELWYKKNFQRNNGFNGNFRNTFHNKTPGHPSTLCMSDENNDNRFFPINQPKVCNLQPEKKNVNDFNQTSNKLQDFVPPQPKNNLNRDFIKPRNPLPHPELDKQVIKKHKLNDSTRHEYTSNQGSRRGSVHEHSVIKDYLCPVSLVGSTIKFSSRKLANTDIRDEILASLNTYGTIENSWWTPDDMLYAQFTARDIAEQVFEKYPKNVYSSY